MPRLNDVTLLAILVREALRRVDIPLVLDHVALKGALQAVLDESEATVYIQSTRDTKIADLYATVAPDPLFADSDALKARGRR